MTLLLKVLIGILSVSLVDCITTECYFKPKWRAQGADANFWTNWYRIRGVVMFLTWYVISYFVDPKMVLPEMILHVCGVEDFIYALWVPLFVKAKEAWKWEPGLQIGPWIFPYEWHWLGEYGGFWKFLSYNLLTFVGGKRVRLAGLVTCVIIGIATVVLIWS